MNNYTTFDQYHGYIEFMDFSTKKTEYHFQSFFALNKIYVIWKVNLNILA